MPLVGRKLCVCALMTLFLFGQLGCDTVSDGKDFFEQGVEVPGTARNELSLLTHTFYPSFNLDGKKLLINDFDSTGRGGFLYIVDVESGSRFFLTEGIAGKWSPVADWILYQCGGQICKIKADGTGKVVLTEDRSGKAPSWSPDGSQFVYVRIPVDEDIPGGIWISGSSGDPDRFVTSFAAGPTWHPDGDLLAFSKSSSTTGGCELTLYHLMTGAEDSLFSNSSCSIRQIQFDPNGGRLSFWNEDGVWIYDWSARTSQNILPFDFPTPITEGRDPVLASHSAWSNDGRVLAYERFAVTKYVNNSDTRDDNIYEGRRSLFVVNVEKALDNNSF